MKSPWNEAKRKLNIETHGVDFTAADGFEWETALYAIDARRDYGETRYAAIGFIGERLYVLIFTIRAGRAWLISLRKANKKEARNYGDYIQS